MSLTRRGFLQVLAAGAAVVSVPILLDGNVASAAIINPNQKYIDALALFDKGVEIYENIIPTLPDYFSNKLLYKAGTPELHQAIDNLFEYIHSNFAIPDNSKEQCDECSNVLGNYNIGRV